MNVKIHTCGMAIAYDLVGGEKKTGLPKLPGRPNGSLASRQKRSIADATEYLRLKFANHRHRKPVIFCLTTPGFTHIANTPKFISRFVDNMRANYGMGEYVWVREHTKKGYPHFHFIAEWHKSKWFFETGCECNRYGLKCQCLTNMQKITAYWSGLFQSSAGNSFRVGSYHPSTKKRSFYVTTPKQCWYLAKYIGKNIGTAHHSSYLVEAGFPSTVYKSTVRSFCISEALRTWSEPTVFDETFVDLETGEEIRSSEGFRCASAIDRRWQTRASGLLLELNTDDVKQYDWRWTGHGQTYIGVKRRPRKGGNKSD